MGIFTRRPRSEARALSPVEMQMLLRRATATQSGVVVDAEVANTLSSVWASIELIAGLGASLPLDEFRVQAGEQVQVPLSAFFTDPDPDPSVTAVAFRAQLLRSAVARGNAYAQLLGGETGTPYGAVTIHPDRVQWKHEQGADSIWRWNIYVDGQRRERWPLGDIWHFALFQQAGSPVGMSPIQYHAQTIGASLAAQRFGQQFFDRSGIPTVLIQPPAGVALTDDQANKLKDKVIAATRGSREPLVMPADISFEKVSISAEDSQFLETQRYGVEEVARIFLGGFPELIGAAVTGGGSITYANREQRMADFIALSLAPRYLVPLEAAMSALLPRGRYVRHNIDALLRADLNSRFNAYKLNAEIASLMGVAPLTGNDMRRLENRPPVDGGDTFTQGGTPNA